MTTVKFRRNLNSVRGKLNIVKQATVEKLLAAVNFAGRSLDGTFSQWRR